MISIMVVEDDPDFQKLLTDICGSSERIQSRGTFGSIEEFVFAKKDGTDETWYPDVLIMDVLSAKDPQFDGASFANALRQSGLKIGVVLLSSIPLGRVLKSFREANPLGWRGLQKNSRISPEQILNAVFEVADEMDSL